MSCLHGETLWQDICGTAISAPSDLCQDPSMFHVGMRVLLAVTMQAALGLENGPNGNWLLNEEKIMLLMVNIKCA